MKGTFFASLCVLALGCGDCTQKMAAPVTLPAQPQKGSEPPATAAPSKTPTTQGTLPLAVALQLVEDADGVGLRVISRADEVITLAEHVSAERSEDGQHVAEALHLRLSCESRGCIKLAPGAELLAPSWLDRSEGERCDARFRPETPGVYVLHVRDCAGHAEASLRFTFRAP